jgi:hypothetical protein
MNEFECLIGWSSFEFPRIYPISVALQHSRPFIHVFGEKARVARFVESPHRAPRLVGYIYILRMAVGAALFAEFNFEDVQQRGLTSIGIAGFLYRQAAGNTSTHEPDPLLCDKTDPGDTTMVVLVRVGETDNPVDAH